MFGFRPGLRERAVLTEELTQGDKFWNQVIYCFRFHWPFTVFNAIVLNPETGLFQFSSLYENYVREIRMWTMDLPFFSDFPETWDDIIPALEVEWPVVSAADFIGNSRTASRLPPLPLLEDYEEQEDSSPNAASPSV